MNIVSFDNVHEQDGIDNLIEFMLGLNRQPASPLKLVIVAMLPEYDDKGVLHRIDCVTVPSEDPGSLSGGLGTLMEGAAQITAGQKRARADAEAKENESTVVTRGRRRDEEPPGLGGR